MKRLLALLLMLTMLQGLCACGSTAQPTPTEEPAAAGFAGSAENAPNEESVPPEPTPEPTPAPPLTFMEENGLPYTMHLSSTQPGTQRANSGSDSLTPDYCKAELTIVSLDRSEPDEEGYVTYTLVLEGALHMWFIYSDEDGDGEKAWVGELACYEIIDRYTGTILPDLETWGDDAYDYTTDINWMGQAYSLSRALTIQWDGRVSDWGEYYSGIGYCHIVDSIRVPAEYDGLTLAWNVGEPQNHVAHGDEIDLEQHVLGEDDPAELGNHLYLDMNTVMTVLGGETETPPSGMPDGRLGDENYEQIRESQDRIWEYPLARMGDVGQKLKTSRGAPKVAESFRFRVLKDPDGKYVFPFDAGGEKKKTITDEAESTSFSELNGFMLENCSEDLQIAILLYDAEGKAVGSSGLIGPGEYLTHISLDEPLSVQPYDYRETHLITEYTEPEETRYFEMNATPYDRANGCMVFCVYDMEGNLRGTNSLDNYVYGNAFDHDWSEDGQ